MGQILTISEIESRFDAEWVLVEDPEVDKDFNVVRGKVAFHSKDRDAVDRKAIELRLKHSARLYTGSDSLDPDSAIIL